MQDHYLKFAVQLRIQSETILNLLIFDSRRELYSVVQLDKTQMASTFRRRRSDSLLFQQNARVILWNKVKTRGITHEGMMDENQTQVRAINRAFRIIQTLQELERGTVTEVANHSGLPKSTVYNHLQTLCANEYVTQEGDQYRIGLRFLEHGGYTRDQMNVFQVSKDEIKKLAKETGELVNLVVEEHGRGVYLYREEGEKAIQLDSYAGKRQYLHSTAFGKAMLAFMPEDHVIDILDRHGMPTRTDQTISTREELFEELSVIRDRGYAYDNEESLEGLRCLAAPILTQNNTVIGAISISGPIRRMSDTRLTEEIPELLLNTTNIIEINVTYA